jgi:hypothetical protein
MGDGLEQLAAQASEGGQATAESGPRDLNPSLSRAAAWERPLTCAYTTPSTSSQLLLPRRRVSPEREAAVHPLL